MSPYRARAARARALFVASLQDGEFPSAAPPDPLLSEERRRAARQPGPAPRRAGRRGALPVPLLRLAADRAPLPELAELRRGRHGARALAVRRRGPRPARARAEEAEERLGAAAAPSERSSRPARRPPSASSPAPWRSAAGQRRPRRGARPPRARAAGRRGRGAVRGPAGPELAAGPAGGPGGARGARRPARCSAPTRSRAGSPARTSGSSSTSCSRSASSPRRIRSGSASSSTTRSSGSTASRRATTRSRGPATSAAGASASPSCSRPRRPSAPGRRSTARAARRWSAPAIQVEAFLDDRGARPRPSSARGRTCSRSPSGRSRTASRTSARAARGAAHRRASRCAAGSTASTSTTAGNAVVRDYKTGKAVLGRRRVRRRGHAADPALHAGRASACSGSSRSAGLYQPLGRGRAERPPAARPRRAASDERLTASTSSAPTAATPEEFERALDAGRGEPPSAPRARCAPGGSAAARSAASAPSTAPSSRSAGSSAPSARSARRTAAGAATDERASRDSSRLTGLEPAPEPTAPRRPPTAADAKRSSRRGVARADRRAGGRDRRARAATLFLEAGAGSGKTTVLVDRYCAAVADDGVEVERILAFTFTERAAAEMRTRIRRELGRALARRCARPATSARADELLHAGAGDRARLGDDDPRASAAGCSAPTRSPPGSTRASGSSTRPRRRGSPTAPPTRRSTSCSPPATRDVARAAAAYQPWRMTQMTIGRPRAPAQPGDERAAAAAGRPTRCTRRGKRRGAARR